MLKQWIGTLILISGIASAGTPNTVLTTFGVKFQVGETAINKIVLMAVGAEHTINIPVVGDVDLKIDQIGVDFQGSAIVVGIDASISAQGNTQRIFANDVVPSNAISVETVGTDFIIYLNLRDYIKAKTNGFIYSDTIAALFSHVKLWSQPFATQDALIEGSFRKLAMTKGTPVVTLSIGSPENYLTVSGDVAITSISPNFVTSIKGSNVQIHANVPFIVLDNWIGGVQGAMGSCISNPKSNINFAKTWITSFYDCHFASSYIGWKIIVMTAGGRIQEITGGDSYVK